MYTVNIHIVIGCQLQTFIKIVYLIKCSRSYSEKYNEKNRIILDEDFFLLRLYSLHIIYSILLVIHYHKIKNILRYDDFGCLQSFQSFYADIKKVLVNNVIKISVYYRLF